MNSKISGCWCLSSVWILELFVAFMWVTLKAARSDILIFSFHSSPSSSAKRTFIMNDVATAKWKEIWINNWSFIVEFFSSTVATVVQTKLRLTTASLEIFNRVEPQQLEFGLRLRLWWRERILKSVRNHAVRRRSV